jgi:predicted hydrocarbon binding protein
MTAKRILATFIEIACKPYSSILQREKMPTLTRENLGEFCSIVCFKAMVTGMEDALGEKATAIALTSAGRTRGKSLVKSFGISNTTNDFDKITALLNEAVGENGTRLTIIDKIIQDGDDIKVYCSETACSAGEEIGSERKCSFSMGAIWGALEEVSGAKLRGTHTESVLRGGTNDVFEFKIFN